MKIAAVTSLESPGEATWKWIQTNTSAAVTSTALQRQKAVSACLLVVSKQILPFGFPRYSRLYVREKTFRLLPLTPLHAGVTCRTLPNGPYQGELGSIHTSLKYLQRGRPLF